MSGQTPDVARDGPPELSTVSERLAGRLGRAIDKAARARAALHVLDWTGCAVAGAAEPSAIAMRKATGGNFSDGLYAGALGNILEMDDVDKRALLHPGPVVIPAALSFSGAVEGEAFLDAVVRGYEAMIRLGRAVGPAHYRYWHNTATCGPVGAAAACASLMRLDQARMATALELACAQASGLWEVRRATSGHAKQLNAARAAHAGVLAARLAQAGFAGVRTIFEGPQGFFAATCGEADPEAVLDHAPDAPWAISDVSFKPWPACRHAHAAIDAALALRSRGAEAARIAAITVRTYKDAVAFCDAPDPATVIGAKFSLQHAVAATLLRGAPTLAMFTEAAIADPPIAALRARVRVIEDARFTQAYPARFGSGVDLALDNGTFLSADIGDALGDPENPAPRDFIIGKARRLMAAGGLGDQDAASLAEAALALADGGDVASWRDRLQRAVRA